jgi:hypothetical protein
LRDFTQTAARKARIAGRGLELHIAGMHEHPRAGSVGWTSVAAALGLGTIVVMLAVMMLGSQVSGILSTVGASVGAPYGGAHDEPNAEPNAPYEQPYGEPGADGGTDTSGGTDTGAGSGSGGSGSGSGVVLAVPRDDLLVIKTGRITVQVADATRAITAASEGIATLGGYASGSKRSGTGVGLAATVTFRIPSGQWDAALNAVRATGEVLTEETATEDVTSTVVDLGARIRNLQVTERALQSIMDKASVIKDVLTVQDELTTTRGEIEKLSSEKAHLEEQAAFSTLTATFQLQPEPAVVVAQTSGFDPADEVDAATAKLIRGLQQVVRAGIWFGIVWLPILLVLAIGAGIAFVIGRWVVRRWGRLQRVDILDAGGVETE